MSLDNVTTLLSLDLFTSLQHPQQWNFRFQFGSSRIFANATTSVSPSIQTMIKFMHQITACINSIAQDLTCD